jgi:hypothetical protein
VINESFTPFPCPRSRAARRTTTGAEGCSEQRILQPVAFATCVVQRNLRHLDELASFERLLRRR